MLLNTLLSPNSIKNPLWPPSQRLEFMWNLLFKLSLGYLPSKRALVSSRIWDVEEDWPVLENLWQGSYTHMNFSAFADKGRVILLKYLTLEGPVITLEKWKPLWVTLEKLSFPPKQSEIEQSAEFSTQCIAICSLKKKSLNECIVMNCLKMHSHLWY